MDTTFTNAHAHIFTGNHAPDFFLETVIRNDTLAKWVKKFLQKDGTRWVISGLLKFYAWVSPKKRAIVRRYLEFVEIGTSINQTKIFEFINRSYTQFPGHKIIVLTQVLDYLDLDDTKSRHIRIRSQVEEVVALKRNTLYQSYIFPFLGVDPRQTGFDLLENWVKKYISQTGDFYGIKIYPAAGFFPFDPRLYPIYEWAEKNGIPIMTHATRSGSFYLGSFGSILNSGTLTLSTLDPNDQLEKKILDRVAALVVDTERHNNNMVWCNIFGHPQNYEVVLKKFPNLKICLAHLGGADEVLRSKIDADPKKFINYPEYLQENWYLMIIELMKKYRNLYSDISYTLSDRNAMSTIVQRFQQPDMIDKFGTPLIGKLMYGTDFYLTQQEEFGDEQHLQRSFLDHFTQLDQARTVAYDSPTNYLRSTIWP